MRCSRSMRAETSAEAVVRELSPRASKKEMRWSSGGTEGLWVVTRRTARWREMVSGFDSTAAFDNEALSLMIPMRSLRVVILPMDKRRKTKNEKERT